MDAVELSLSLRLPTYWQYERMTLRERMGMKRDVHTELHDLFRAAGVGMRREIRKHGRKLQLTYRLPADCRFAVPTQMTPHVYRKAGEDRCDAHNFVTPLDKLVIDLLTEPGGPKWRGFGLIPDDSPRWFHLAPVVLHRAADVSRLRLVLRGSHLPQGLSKLFINSDS